MRAITSIMVRATANGRALGPQRCGPAGAAEPQSTPARAHRRSSGLPSLRSRVPSRQEPADRRLNPSQPQGHADLTARRSRGPSPPLPVHAVITTDPRFLPDNSLTGPRALPGDVDLIRQISPLADGGDARCVVDELWSYPVPPPDPVRAVAGRRHPSGVIPVHPCGLAVTAALPAARPDSRILVSLRSFWPRCSKSKGIGYLAA